jgi:hypothetical protein
LSLLSLLTGYRNYKKLLKEVTSQPTIPYLGLFLREITHICDGNPKEIKRTGESAVEGEEKGGDESGKGGAESGNMSGKDVTANCDEKADEEEVNERNEDDDDTDGHRDGECVTDGDKLPSDESAKLKSFSSFNCFTDVGKDTPQGLNPTLHNWERLLLLGARISEVLLACHSHSLSCDETRRFVFSSFKLSAFPMSYRPQNMLLP